MAVKGDRAFWEAESFGTELIQTTIGDMLDQQAEAKPDKEALVYNYPELGINIRYNYRQYRDEVNKVAKGLLALGIEKGEHIAIWAINIPEWILLEMAAAKVGAVLVTINTAYKATEVEYVLRQGDVTTLFLMEQVRSNSYLDAIYNVAPELKELADPATQNLQSISLPKLKRVVLFGSEAKPGTMLFSKLIELGKDVSDETLQQRQSQIKSDDIDVIMYTSGTTGFPKGVMLTHSNVINMAHVIGRGNDYSEERYCTPMPFFHIAGYCHICMMLVAGATLIPVIAFDPAKTLELLSKERATMTFAVPTMLVAMLNHPRFLAGEFDLPNLRLVSSGATTVPVALMEQVKAKMGADVGIAFGMTESTAAATLTKDSDSFELKSATIGIAYPHLSIKIVNPATGELVGFNEPGELMVKGWAVMKGYYNMPEKTAETLDADGWLHTGDLASMNEQGYINIVGRLKDMIIRGGENIYPAEIEAFLMRNPKIAEAQIVGVPDAFMGEEMVALIKLKAGETATEEEIRQYCRDNISRFKVPKYVQFVTEYPLTASGKVKKFELKAQLIKNLGLEEVAAMKTA